MVLEDLLDAARAEYKQTSKNYEFAVCCPFCELRGYSADVAYHLGLNVRNGKAHCFRCDWKSGDAVYTAKQLIYAFRIEFNFKERHLIQHEPEKKKVVIKLKPVALPAEYETLAGSCDFVGKKVRRYLEGRGVSMLQVVKHKVGYAESGKYAWRAVFPVRGRDGRTYGYVTRAIRKDQDPPYLNSPGLKMLWNTNTPGNVAILLEGIMDALRVETFVLRAGRGQQMVPVARLGSALTALQVEQLRMYPGGVVLFPDFDLAGIKGAVGVGKILTGAGISLRVILPPGVDGRDPGDMDAEEILHHIDNAQPWGEGTAYRLRLATRRML